MLLKNLIKNIPQAKKKIKISGLSTDSRKVKKNYIFFAIKGNENNGEVFINEAIKKGASVIVCSKKYNFKHKDILVIKKNNVRNFLSQVSSKFFKYKPKNIFAVTGTNGKTSVADIFYQLLTINKIPASSIGTLGVKYNNNILKTDLTTPSTILIHKYLNDLKKKGIDNVIIEASSHGLEQNRLHNINFKAGIFTNFSQDHLDYHKSMKAYLNSKLILFNENLNNKSKIISDDEIKPFNQLKKIAKKKNIKILEIKTELNKLKNHTLEQISDFKKKNIAMAIKAVKLCGLKDKHVYKSIKKLKDISGRLEMVKNYSGDIKVFVDYAHTPDALLKTLNYLKNNYGENITLVFGCGGNRDKKKRPLMAKIANKICNKIYITDDNPRQENPKKIRNELAKYIFKKKIFNIGNRALAIKTAIKNAEPKEIILIAGKGHEEQQIYKNKIKNFSDKKIVKKVKRKNFNQKELSYYFNNLVLKRLLPKKNKINFDGISIDSRTVKKDNLFIALKGKKYDGNKFIGNALKKGAKFIISSNRSDNKKVQKTNNPILFLKKFAQVKRNYCKAKVIAITGSTGKTSLKNLLKELLVNYGKTYSSPKSFNNHLGVPISLSNLGVNDNYGIFEVGMSHAGEIKNLSKLIKPHLGVITNIGEAHIENFKNEKGIAEAKSEIMENIEKGGVIILNRDDKFYNYLFNKARIKKLKVSTFGRHKDSDIRVEKIIKKNDFSKIIININNVKIDFEINDLNIYNVLASITVLKELNLDISKIKLKLKHLSPSEGRGKKYFISRYNKKINFIDESYNANPSSVKTAIKKLDSINKGNYKKYLILGDMLELGSKSKKYHEELSKVINNSDIDKIFIKGKKTIFTYKHLIKEKRGNILQNDDDVDLCLSEMISNNDFLMIKGSNATGLNSFSKKLIRGV